MEYLEQYAKTMVGGKWIISASVDSLYVIHVRVDGVETEYYTEIDQSLNIDIEANRFVKEIIVNILTECQEKKIMDINYRLLDRKKTLDLNALSLHCNGQEFDQAPIEWQRIVEDMYKRGVRFEVSYE